jgi:hypothetical protein
MGSRHLLIAGTGRAGTTALVQLLGGCGLDTGADDLWYFNYSRAGLEAKLDREQWSYVVKRPYFSDELAGMIADGFDPAQVDAIIVPLRDLDDAASSRIKIFTDRGHRAAGGLWHNRRPGRQRAELAESLYALLVTATDHGIPLAFLGFPRFIDDPEYAWSCLERVLPTVERDTFLAAHAELVRPEMVSDLAFPSRSRMALLDIRWAVLAAMDRAIRVFGLGGRSRPY